MLHRSLGWLCTAAQTQGSKALTSEGRPFALVHREITAVREHIHSLVANTNNEVLDHAGKYALAAGGKLMRPALVALMAHAMLPLDVSARLLEEPIGSLDEVTPGTILPFLRLAEVTELIHTASLVHDDVIDSSDMRRGRPALHKVYDTKRAVLAGDYILARASFYIATLQVPRIVILMTTALEELMSGELLQMDGCFDIPRYEQKSFCKTASLISNSLASTAVLVDPGNEALEQTAFDFGRHLGIAFQILDDCLDITGDEKTMGKPKLADMKEGIATIPVLLVAQRNAKVDKMVRRRFSELGDVEYCLEAMEKEGAVAEAIQRADEHCRLGIESLHKLHHSPARDALANALLMVINRKS
ncbi:solanesyl-diphosphate synthase, putative [Leishmania panamensis]|uniref:Solanesyl-diphosphate synthase, putative n=1 Tax=Leishmania panamensis TaxID=5679 RepID=A0A088RLX1_LEIPA|nr:solanesyl-diphosphate synthase, putative [Leishmania panamensis]AIN96825.1 solanesyl-diphosphate synthase, putative [Leishmania panamensis]